MINDKIAKMTRWLAGEDGFNPEKAPVSAEEMRVFKDTAEKYVRWYETGEPPILGKEWEWVNKRLADSGVEIRQKLDKIFKED